MNCPDLQKYSSLEEANLSIDNQAFLWPLRFMICLVPLTMSGVVFDVWWLRTLILALWLLALFIGNRALKRADDWRRCASNFFARSLNDHHE